MLSSKMQKKLKQTISGKYNKKAFLVNLNKVVYYFSNNALDFETYFGMTRYKNWAIKFNIDLDDYRKSILNNRKSI